MFQQEQANLRRFKRRLLMRQVGGLVLIVGTGIWYVLAPPKKDTDLFPLYFVLLLFVIFNFFNWRCPSCDVSLPRGVPKSCPKCGMSFRDGQAEREKSGRSKVRLRQPPA